MIILRITAYTSQIPPIGRITPVSNLLMKQDIHPRHGIEWKQCGTTKITISLYYESRIKPYYYIKRIRITIPN